MHFILLCEGPSDLALVSHLRLLLIECGAREVTGAPLDFRRLPDCATRDTSAKVRCALQLEQHIDLLFVHRDADASDPQPRYTEISTGVAQAGFKGAWIGVVPVQETESWLLLDELAIRRVSGRPRGRGILNLPPPNHVERTAHPKERLEKAIVMASEATGRRLRRIKKKLPALREQLLAELKPNGPLLYVTSWNRLKTDVQRYLS